MFIYLSAESRKSFHYLFHKLILLLKVKDSISTPFTWYFIWQTFNRVPINEVILIHVDYNSVHNFKCNNSYLQIFHLSCERDWFASIYSVPFPILHDKSHRRVTDVMNFHQKEYMKDLIAIACRRPHVPR